MYMILSVDIAKKNLLKKEKWGFFEEKAAFFVEILYLPILFMWSKPKYILALIKSNCRSNVLGKQKLDSLL